MNKRRTCSRASALRWGFPECLQPNPQSDADQLEAAADQAIAACGGDAREAVKTLIFANHFLETDLEKPKAAVSMGHARGEVVRGGAS
jgi:hypothetical protein